MSVLSEGSKNEGEGIMVTTLTGKNSYMVVSELKRLVSEHVQNYGDLSLQQFDGDEVGVDELREAVMAMPFLAAEKMVVVRNLAGRKDVFDDLIQIIQATPESTKLVVADEKLDKRTAIYKVLSSFDFNEYSELSENELANWLVVEAKARGVELDSRLARLLVQRAGENQWILASELQKLIDSDEPITETLLHDMVEEHPRETIFQLLDEVVQGHEQKALKIYQQLRTAQLDPHYIISMIVWQLHLLGFLQTAAGRTPDQVAREAKASPYVLKKLSSAARHISKKDFVAMLDYVVTADRQIKSASVDADSIVEHLISRLATISSH